MLYHARDDECDPFKVPSRIKAFARSAVQERLDPIFFIYIFCDGGIDPTTNKYLS